MYRWLRRYDGGVAHAFCYSNNAISLCHRHNRLATIWVKPMVGGEKCPICRMVEMQQEREERLDADNCQ